jgi:hypothetical protein
MRTAIDSLPPQGQLAHRFHAQALAGDQQCILGHDYACWRTSQKGVTSVTVSST